MTRTERIAQAVARRLEREREELERKGFVRSVTVTVYFDQRTAKVYGTDFSCIERVLD